ncbi:protein adenylyltransferase SelO [Shewanella marina]|uniref:protein adenylyltransferase SelO n=1 Tax=Shewanella marina TaxID=487319 RepID=UPI000471BE4A|nr:YdiU family protein [Shewanella marina]
MQFKYDFFEQLTSLYQVVSPSAIDNPSWLAWSDDAAQLIHHCQQSDHLLQQFAGQQPLPQAHYYAQVYSGHQFGGYSPRLGDGRSIIVGEVLGPQGAFDMALKGAGKTPFSRHGDGRAVMRSSIREFLASEAMYHLGIPTSRALAVVGSDTPVLRQQMETAAITVRLARSHIRFGHFEYLTHTLQAGKSELKQLVDFCIKQHYQYSCDSAGYHAWFHQVVQDTARMIAHWQAVGFCHGVMNTDNMSILGDTFDYGPFAFLDTYHEDFICNKSDGEGRYAFSQQVSVGFWNLQCLAQALTPLLESDVLVQALQTYQPLVVEHYLYLMRQKLGLAIVARNQQRDFEIIGQLTHVMQTQRLDYTLTLRQLAEEEPFITKHPVRDHCIDPQAFDAWYDNYLEALPEVTDTAQWQQQRLAVNPKYVLRNYLAQEAIIGLERGDKRPFELLYQTLRQPYITHTGAEALTQRPPDWGEGLILSCSS